jgi:hypothetical protein
VEAVPSERVASKPTLYPVKRTVNERKPFGMTIMKKIRRLRADHTGIHSMGVYPELAKRANL